MALHRYGGGCGESAFRRIVRMPFPALVRLVGAARRATEIRSGDGPHQKTREEDDAIMRAIEAKEAEMRAAKQTPAPA